MVPTYYKSSEEKDFPDIKIRKDAWFQILEMYSGQIKIWVTIVSYLVILAWVL